MDRSVSDADANRSFSEILREVRDGKTFVVTEDGKPVARIVPFTQDMERRLAARDALLKRLDSQPAMNLGPWTRDELYER